MNYLFVIFAYCVFIFFFLTGENTSCFEEKKLDLRLLYNTVMSQGSVEDLEYFSLIQHVFMKSLLSVSHASRFCRTKEVEYGIVLNLSKLQVKWRDWCIHKVSRLYWVTWLILNLTVRYALLIELSLNCILTDRLGLQLVEWRPFWVEENMQA